jgi:hypothetical protein
MVFHNTVFPHQATGSNWEQEEDRKGRKQKKLHNMGQKAVDHRRSFIRSVWLPR